jgi:hypothetical protein
LPSCRLLKADNALFQSDGQGSEGPNQPPEVSQNRVLTLAPGVSAAFGGSRSTMGRTSPVGLPLFIALDPHAESGGGLGLTRSPQKLGEQHRRRRLSEGCNTM